MGRGAENISDEANRDAVARSFVAARQARRSLSNYPGRAPIDLAEAYAIQDATIPLWGEPVGGWKVGRINAPLDRRLGANRLAGPVLARRIVEAPSGEATIEVIAGGFAAGEAEFMIRLGEEASAGGPLPTDDDAVLRWIDTVRIGIEIAASPYARVNADGPCVTISDHGNNLALVLGADVPPERWSRLHEIEITSAIDGQAVGQANTGSMLDGPRGAVRFLLGNLGKRGIAPRAGWWISTGAITGVHEMTPGQTFRAEFDGVGTIACRVET